MPYEQIWGKYSPDYGFYPLLGHLCDTAVTAKIIFDQWLRPGLREIITADFGEKPEHKIALALGLHDIGKANPVFQGQLAASKHNAATIRRHYQQLKDDPQLAELFIEMAPKYAKYPTIRRHEQVGALHLLPHDNNESLLFDRPVESQWLSAIISGHHGSFFTGNNKPDPREFKKTREARGEPWSRIRNGLITQLELFCRVKLEDLPKKVSPVTVMLLTGMLIIADRLSSGDDWVKEQNIRLNASEFSLDMRVPAHVKTWWKDSSQRMRIRVEKLLGFYRPLHNPREALLGKWSPRPAQTQAESAGDGLLTIMAATGSGKTEAALLRHSQQAERLIFLLPTMATTNAMMRRLQVIYEGTDNIGSLAHGMSILEDFYNQPENANTQADDNNATDSYSAGLYPTDFVRTKSARLLAPVSVGTVDQAAMAALPLKWTPLRLLALANAHVVLDEVHTLDAYQTKLIEPLLTWLGKTKTRVTLLSATMPHQHLAQITAAYLGKTNSSSSETAETTLPSYDFPATLVAVPEKKWGVTPLEIDTKRDTYQIDYILQGLPANASTASVTETHINWAEQSRQNYPQARLGIFVNTIDRAQVIAKQLHDKGHEVLVLHSRLTAQHRSQVEERLNHELGPNGKAKGITVVGTQTIEASLDIDLDLLSTDLSPAPSLIQRFGRAWRHRDSRRNERIPDVDRLKAQIVHGNEPIFESTSDKKTFAWWLPYYYSPVARTLKWLQEHEGVIRAPEDIQSFVQSAWISLGDLEQEPDYDFISAQLQAGMKADYWTGSWEDFFAQKPRMSTLQDLTGTKDTDPDGDSPLTRFNLGKTIQVILVGNDKNVPGIYTGDTENLHKLQSLIDGEINPEIKQALRAQVAISSEKMIEIITDARQSQHLEDGVSSLLAGKILLHPGRDFIYDPLTGLQLAQ